jgi:chromosome segregation ATPase
MSEDLPMISLPTDSTKVDTPLPAGKPVPGKAEAPAPAKTAPRAAEEDDPERLLREYAERQKTRIVKLEQQLGEFRKAVAERDALKARAEALERELAGARRQLEHAAKVEAALKDVQAKLDAAVLSNNILSEDKEKLKKALAEQTAHFRKAEERALQAERALARETEARQAAEARIAAAVQALQRKAPAAEAPAPPKPAPSRAEGPAPAARK